MSAPPVAADPTAPPEAIEVHCPLCEYDLRGLVEPRCPECGYRFDWLDLTDPARRRHRYLFEHHPESNVWSFLRTMLGHVLPRRFWGELIPSQPSRPVRLAVYALLVVMSFVPPLIMAALIDTNVLPVVVPWMRWSRLQYTMFSSAIRLDGLVLLWPLLTLAGMMIFAWSMRRARLRRVHLVRCVVYASDLILWINLTLTIVRGYDLVHYFTAGQWVNHVDDNAAWVFALAIVPFAYRLCVAFKKYLRFDHPIATVLSTQVIALLVVLIVIVASAHP